MSYIAREPPIVQQTQHCVMTDVECIDEAIKNIGGTVVGKIKQNQDITLKINNKNWTLKKQTGRYALTHMSNQNVSWVNKLRNQYNIAEHKKREALRREQERLNGLEQQLAKLNAEAAEAERQGNMALFESEKAAEMQKREAELAQSQLEVVRLEAEQARILAQKEKTAHERTAELETRAKRRNWTVKTNKSSTKRRTKIRLTK